MYKCYAHGSWWKLIAVEGSSHHFISYAYRIIHLFIAFQHNFVLFCFRSNDLFNQNFSFVINNVIICMIVMIEFQRITFICEKSKKKIQLCFSCFGCCAVVLKDETMCICTKISEIHRKPMKNKDWKKALTHWLVDKRITSYPFYI